MNPDVIKLKICMAGEAMVGKTSLIRRFVLQEYDDRYTATLGTKIAKKTVQTRDPKTGDAAEVNIMLWDVMGTPTLRDLLKEAYYHGTHGVLGVADLTRKETLRELDAWYRSIETVAGPVPTYIVANKADLEDQVALTEDAIATFCDARGWPWSYTSAKTGKGVEEAFAGLVQRILAVHP